ncbi:hypothetical protein KFK09_000512 [Dendrobium nobile]|uniref:Uncharacterized protein n=1 Tax=Dendrobium nobile TaxID=94219 RepID=A0A8T3CEY1_DENNO|nr:hypothetical protein KFK09_000512 [Dendrobium nobile]
MPSNMLLLHLFQASFSLINIFHQYKDEINTPKFLKEVVMVCGFQVILNDGYDGDGCGKGNSWKLRQSRESCCDLGVHKGMICSGHCFRIYIYIYTHTHT